MPPHTVGGLAGGMAHGGHIHRENYGFISIDEPVPTSAFSHNPDLYWRCLTHNHTANIYIKYTKICT
jgi:hypothetical protein